MGISITVNDQGSSVNWLLFVFWNYRRIKITTFNLYENRLKITLAN